MLTYFTVTAEIVRGVSFKSIDSPQWRSTLSQYKKKAAKTSTVLRLHEKPPNGQMKEDNSWKMKARYE